ncbi:hypothetical protein HAX54_009828, partial [Datura stramonium]|nr:hypothetical protein [Datura stramonium]
WLHVHKDKEAVAIASKGFKRLERSCIELVSPKGTLARRFGAKDARSRDQMVQGPKRSTMSRRIGLIKVIWRLSSPPFMTPL